MAIWDGLFSNKKDNKNVVGNKIRNIRNRKDISAKELGEAAGVNESAIRNYESGIRNVGEDKLDRIAAALNVPKETLYDRHINSYGDVIHILFELSEVFGFIPLSLPQEPEYAVSVNDETIQKSLKAWFIERRKWEQGKISTEEFQNWKDSFPYLCIEEENENEKHGDRMESAYTDFERIIGLKSAVTSFDLIVKNNVEEILACMEHKDYKTAKLKLETMRSTVHTLSTVEIQKYA